MQSSESNVAGTSRERRENETAIVSHIPEETSLATLLSQLLVAWTIEFDNEVERRLPHRITAGGKRGRTGNGPWLVSFALWANFMQYVDADGISLRAFRRRARFSKKALRTWLVRMSKWWGYVRIAPDPDDGRSEPRRAEWLVRPTPGGLLAQEVWRSTMPVIEERWRSRFGATEIAELRASLLTLVRNLDMDLPDFLPILESELVTQTYSDSMIAAVERPERGAADTPTITLLANVLLAFALEFDAEAEVSLAIGANVLRVIGKHGTLLRDLPALGGISKESVAMAITILTRKEYAVVECEPDRPREKILRLTVRGEIARRDYETVRAGIERRWQKRFGTPAIAKLRADIERVIQRSDREGSLLARGLRPYPDGWRARKPYLAQTEAVLRDPRAALPHFPMVLHRGGWPDGS